MDYQKEIARVLLEIGAVGFKPSEPLTFKSGIVSPVYVDNRIFPYYPEKFQLVIEGFENKAKEGGFNFEIVGGIATGGIPYSAVLGYRMKKPSIYVRKESKGYGKDKRVEGGEVKDKRVLLVEDLVTTGGSSLSGVKALRDEGAIVENCLVIVSYGFEEAINSFENEKVKLYALTSFPVILEEALEMGKLTNEEAETIKDWLSDPHGWAGRHGFDKK